MNRTPSLNPFEFRAGIYFRARRRAGHGPRVLIPLNSGLVFTCGCKSRINPVFGLNPFEFRAGIYFAIARNTYGEIVRLNPFEFRAGIYFGISEG